MLLFLRPFFAVSGELEAVEERQHHSGLQTGRCDWMHLLLCSLAWPTKALGITSGLKVRGSNIRYGFIQMGKIGKHMYIYIYVCPLVSGNDY